MLSGFYLLACLEDILSFFFEGGGKGGCLGWRDGGGGALVERRSGSDSCVYLNPVIYPANELTRSPALNT